MKRIVKTYAYVPDCGRLAVEEESARRKWQMNRLNHRLETVTDNEFFNYGLSANMPKIIGCADRQRGGRT